MFLALCGVCTEVGAFGGRGAFMGMCACMYAYHVHVHMGMCKVIEECWSALKPGLHGNLTSLENSPSPVSIQRRTL
jgi:hypothetical protein